MKIYLNLLGVLIEQKKNENGKTKIDFFPDAKEMYLKIKSLAEKNDCALQVFCSIFIPSLSVFYPSHQ